MIIWVSSESMDPVDEPLWKLYMQIEKDINTHLKSINYKHEILDSLDAIIILRNDDVFKEITRFRPKKRDTDLRLKIDYNSFLNGNDNKRKILIYEFLLRAIEILKIKKKLKDFEPLEEYISIKIKELN